MGTTVFGIGPVLSYIALVGSCSTGWNVISHLGTKIWENKVEVEKYPSFLLTTLHVKTHLNNAPTYFS